MDLISIRRGPRGYVGVITPTPKRISDDGIRAWLIDEYQNEYDSMVFHLVLWGIPVKTTDERLIESLKEKGMVYNAELDAYIKNRGNKP